MNMNIDSTKWHMADAIASIAKAYANINGNKDSLSYGTIIGMALEALYSNCHYRVNDTSADFIADVTDEITKEFVSLREMSEDIDNYN